jgi:hypothetical protein
MVAVRPKNLQKRPQTRGQSGRRRQTQQPPPRREKRRRQTCNSRVRRRRVGDATRKKGRVGGATMGGKSQQKRGWRRQTKQPLPRRRRRRTHPYSDIIFLFFPGESWHVFDGTDYSKDSAVRGRVASTHDGTVQQVAFETEGSSSDDESVSSSFTAPALTLTGTALATVLSKLQNATRFWMKRQQQKSRDATPKATVRKRHYLRKDIRHCALPLEVPSASPRRCAQAWNRFRRWDNHIVA